MQFPLKTRVRKNKFVNVNVKSGKNSIKKDTLNISAMAAGD